MFMILNKNNDIMRLGAIQKDGSVKEESTWRTREDAEQALWLILNAGVAGDLDQRNGCRIIEYPDS